MSHILKKPEITRCFNRVVSATPVEYDGKGCLCVEAGIKTSKADVLWAKLPDSIPVIGSNGQRIIANKGRCLWITVATEDPHHFLTEQPEEENVAKRTVRAAESDRYGATRSGDIPSRRRVSRTKRTSAHETDT